MHMWTTEPDPKAETKPKKRADKDLSDESTQDEGSVGEPESPTRSEAADHEPDNLDRVIHNMPTAPAPRKITRNGLALRQSYPEGATIGTNSRVLATLTPTRRSSIDG